MDNRPPILVNEVVHADVAARDMRLQPSRADLFNPPLAAKERIAVGMQSPGWPKISIRPHVIK